MAANGDDASPLPSLRQPRPQTLTATQSRHSPALREDCWSEEATHALIEAWGSHHLALNRGNLRQHHWLEVAAIVNSSGDRRRRTDIQCKNRIDTLKKRYKVEKSKTVESSGAYISPWPFFTRLDFLISGGGGSGSGGSEKALPSRKLSPDTPSSATALTKFPVGPRSTMKRKRPVAVDDSFFRRQFAAVVAATAEVEEEDREGESSERTGTSSDEAGRRERRERVREREREENGGFKNGCQQLAEAITRFGEVYERVETVKQEQLIELEKHRMQFTKDLEYQRMKLFMDTQLQLARIKLSKHSHNADSYL